MNDRLYVKALVLKKRDNILVLITVDAVAIAEIGTIRDRYLEQVRKELKGSLNIEPDSVIINASHCHGIVCADIAEHDSSCYHSVSKYGVCQCWCRVRI